MNSIAIVNWEDKEFWERVTYSLTKARYVLTEDYESIGVRTAVWEKPSNLNQVGRYIESDPLAPLRLLPAEAIAARLIDRLETFMPEGTPRWMAEQAAINLAFDLMGKPG
jgi:uncharacterized protein (DUF2126 family)